MSRAASIIDFKRAELNKGKILAAFQQEGATVDTVASLLGLHREAVNAQAPWHRAELTLENADQYEVELVGDECEWDFRPLADSYTEDGEPRGGYYDDEGRPRTGKRKVDAKGNETDELEDGHAEKVVAEARASTRLMARSKDEAVSAALAMHPGYHTVAGCKKLDG